MAMAIAAMLEVIRGLRFKGKVGAAFGSYGWSGEAPKAETGLAEAGIEIVADALRMSTTRPRRASSSVRPSGRRSRRGCRRGEATCRGAGAPERC